ncbi:MAG: hypothetical protein U0U69_06100 [Acidimicrobiia bacterium]
MLLAHAFSTSGPWAWVVYVGIGLCAFGAARLAGMLRWMPEKAAGALIVAGVVVAAVAGTLHPEAPDPNTRPTSPGKVTIETPTSGTKLESSQADVSVRLTDFELAPLGALGQPRAGFGHLHVTVDGQLQPQTESTTFTVCVPSGPHTIAAVLVAEDHFGFRNEADLTDTVAVEGASDARC